MELKIETRRIYHGIILGQTGYGKSTLLERIAEIYHKNGYKIIDLWNNERLEGSFFSLPSQFRFWEGKAKGLPTRVLFPVSKELPRVLPSICKPFTIPINQIDLDDMRVFLASELGRSFRSLYYGMKLELPDNNDIVGFIKGIERLANTGFVNIEGLPIKAMSKIGYRDLLSSFYPFLAQGTLTSESHPLTLNLEKELKDNETITVLSQKFIFNREMKYFITVWFLRKIFELKSLGKVKKPILIISRELSDLLPTNPIDESQRLTSYWISQILKQGRGIKLSMWGDNQSPSELSSVAYRQFGYVFSFRITTPDDIQKLSDGRGIIFLQRSDLARLVNLPIGKFLAITPFDFGFYRAVVPSTYHRREGQDFFSIWKKLGNGFVNYTEDIDSIFKQISDSVKKEQIKVAKEVREKRTVEETFIDESEIPRNLKDRFQRLDIERHYQCSKRKAVDIINKWITNNKAKREGGGNNFWYKRL